MIDDAQALLSRFDVTTSAVDIGSLRVKAVIPVGQVPKRNITFVFP